ncbi:MAG TPA: hypothetical protein VGV61_07280 [Thermoanaerobaculia bacterium]|jgi:O-antigen/teichoic acid export membrane protein|nr:hypothetical protein [Thermoanaerobaculia bacterium]
MRERDDAAASSALAAAVAIAATGEAVPLALPPVTLAPAAAANAGAAGQATSVAGALLRRRLRAWTGILSAYFGTQTVTQLLGIAAGILFIRTMPVQEFALYTLATSVITFFAFATDLGSTTSLVHFYHRAAKEGEDFGRYLAAVLSLRRIAFVAGALVVAVALPAAAHAKGFRPLDIALVTAAVIPAVGFQIVAAVRQLTLRLHDRYAQSYRADLAGGATRLLLAVLMVASAALRSWLGVLTAAGASAYTAWLAQQPRDGVAEAPAAFDLAPYRRAVLRYLLPTLPSALYFAIQGPLVVWLAATFGASRNIAEVGALTRLGLVVGIFSGLTGIVFMPRLARIHDERVYRHRVLQFGAVHLALASGLVLAAYRAPDLFLWLLGPHYAGLHRELLLVVAGSGLVLLDGYLVAVNLARSWTRWQGLAMASLVAAQAALVSILPLTTSAGVLRFNVASAAAALAGQMVIVTLGFLRPQWVVWTASVRHTADEPAG